jgi:NADH-quinone oxidoreductase subunit C
MTGDIFDGLDPLMDSRPDPRTSGVCRMVIIAPGVLIPAARRLLEADYHLEDISGLDAVEGFLVTYHFDRFDHCDGTPRLAVRVLVSHDEARLPSIAAVFSGAEWHEREIMDFFGVAFDGNPNPVALLLPEMDDSTPLRKAEDKRRRLRELIKPGTVVSKAQHIDWFDAEPQASIEETKRTGGKQPGCTA